MTKRIAPGERYRFYLEHLYIETDGCKIWPYSTGGNGYGVFTLDKQKYYVHHLACQAYNGPMPAGMVASHGPCHNPACWSGFHLTWKSRIDDSLDRWRDGSVQHGEEWVRSKLTQAQVDDIRHQVATGIKQSVMAEKYSISRPTVCNIVSGRTWNPKMKSPIEESTGLFNEK